MSVEPDDVVTIITDDDHLDEANALAQVVVERGGYPVIANNEHQVQRAIADMRFPMAPPRNLHQAMTSSDEIIIITNLEWANRFAHVSAVRESCDNNAKIASVEEGIGSWNLTEADIRDATDRARAAIAALNGATWCRVTSAGRHRRPRLHRGATGAGGDADQEARPDDGSGAALGGSRLRRGRGPHRGDDRRRRDHARHRPARSDPEPDHLESRKGSRHADHRRRRSRKAEERSSRASPAPT